MPKLHFKIDPDNIEFDEVIAIQSGQLKVSKAVLVRFVTDAKGNPLPEEEAAALVGKLKLTEIGEVFTAFGEALQAATSSVLPNG